MKGIRVLTAVVALLALPLVAVHAQGRGKGLRPNSDVCASPAGQSGNVPPGQAKKCPVPPPPAPVPPPPPAPVPPPPPAPVPPPPPAPVPPPPPAPVPPPPPAPVPPPPPAPVPPPPPPPPSSPPSGVNFAGGTVYADLDADGTYSPFAGDTVLAGWTVQLLWNGAVVNSASTDVNGAYRFDGLGNTGSSSWELCVVMQSGFSQGPAQGGGYTGCAGTGYAFPFNSAFATMFQGNFSMLPL